MRKVGSWFLPDNENYQDTLDAAESNLFSCYGPISEAIEYVEKFDNAIDVGAWIGDSTDIISKNFKKVHAFEANKIVYECLEENLKTKKNIVFYNYALSNSDNEKLFYNKLSTFGGYIHTNEFDPVTFVPTEKQIVKCQTLDYYNFADIDFIKIDVDSHEGFLLEGALNFFKNNNPVVLIEYKKRIIKERQNNSIINPIEHLKSIGYKLVKRSGDIDYIFKR